MIDDETGPTRGDEHVQLPFVIRPAAPRLVELESRILREPGFCRQLQQRPDFCHTLARAVFMRDRQARLRFPDTAALAVHLQSLIAG